MGFQTSVNLTSPVGTLGAKASSNPVATVDAGPGGFVADLVNGIKVALFAWIDSTGTILTNYAPGGIPTLPAGFIANEMQAFITKWLGDSSLIIPPGMMATLFGRGDFWAQVGFAAASLTSKVYVNLFSGAVVPGAPGAFLTYPAGSAAAFTASFATTKMTVTAVASGTIGIGHLVGGAGLPANTRVLSQDSGTLGGAGVYSLSTTPGTVASAAFTSTPADSVGGAAVTASFATNVMTVTAVADGVLVPGQLLQAATAGLTAGTYITSQASGTAGGVGTYNLSTTPGTIASGNVTASAWIETPWYFNSAANPGELAKIGVRN